MKFSLFTTTNLKEISVSEEHWALLRILLIAFAILLYCSIEMSSPQFLLSTSTEQGKDGSNNE